MEDGAFFRSEGLATLGKGEGDAWKLAAGHHWRNGELAKGEEARERRPPVATWETEQAKEEELRERRPPVSPGGGAWTPAPGCRWRKRAGKGGGGK